MKIRAVHQRDEIWDLLLEADPDAQKVMTYLDLGKTYVATEKNNVLGVVVLQQITLGSVEVKNLAVQQACRRRGIASQLLTFVIDKVMKEMPECAIYVKTANTSYPALALYERQGFVLSEIIDNYFPTHYKQPIFENGQQAVDQYILKYQK